MKRAALWKLSVATCAQAEDAVSELLVRTFGQPACSYTNIETGATTVTAYFEQKPQWSPALRAALQKSIQQLARYGLQFAPGTAQLSRVRREDWADSWKRHFKRLTIGSKLVVTPSWLRQPRQPGQAEVVLDPGLSFGTGQHPTTSFCLRQLVARRRPGQAQAFLDMGTGSGILAIAAVKLGYKPVEAFDFDPDAVRVAQANAQANRVLDKLQLSRQNITRLPQRSRKRYELICANLMANLLLEQRGRILARLAPQGVLVLAGILNVEFASVQSAYEAAGLRLVASRVQKEWRSGSFVWSAARPGAKAIG